MTIGTVPRTRLLDAARDRERRCVELLREVIRTPSLSGGEQAVVERLAAEMRDLGYDEVVVDPFGSVIGRIGSGPVRIVMDSHVDTVDVGCRDEWSTDPYEPVLDDGIIYGRGASDDKAGIAAMVHGAALARDEAWTDDVTLWVVGSVHEEDCDGLALEHVLTRVLPRPDVVVLGEATNGGLYRGNRGRIEALIRTRGSSCHGSAPDRGHNPVYDLAPICIDVEKLNARLGWDEFLGAGSIALTKITCDTPSLNSVPSTATLYVDRRLTLGESPQQAMEELRSLASVVELDAEVELLSCEQTSFTGMTLSMPKEYRTWAVPEDSLAVHAGLAAGERALGRRPSTGSWVFSTNGVASMGKLGIPTIGYGPGDEIHAHTVADQCPVRDLSDAMAFYAGFPAVYAEQVKEARERHPVAAP